MGGLATGDRGPLQVPTHIHTLIQSSSQDLSLIHKCRLQNTADVCQESLTVQFPVRIKGQTNVLCLVSPVLSGQECDASLM